MKLAHFISLGIVLLFAEQLRAQVVTFTNADGNSLYSDPNNWSTGVVPTTSNGQTALIGSGYAVIYSGDIGDLMFSNGGVLNITTGGSFTQTVANNYIQLGEQGSGPSTGNGAVVINGGTFNQGTASSFPFNITGTGNTFTINSGTANFDNSYSVSTGLTAYQNGGTVNLTGGGGINIQSLLQMTGGTFTNTGGGGMTINSGGVFNLSGGTFTVGNVGTNIVGTFNQTGGTYSATGSVGVTGTFTQSGGSFTGDRTSVGGTGSFTLSGGSATIGSEFDFNNTLTTISGGILNTPLVTGVNSGGGQATLNIIGGVLNLNTAGAYIYGASSAADVNFTTGSTGYIIFTGASASTVQNLINSEGIEINGASTLQPLSAFSMSTNASGTVLALAQSGSTTNGIWTDTSGSANWSNTGNWIGLSSSTPISPGLNAAQTNVDTATFGELPGAPASETVNIDTTTPSLSSVTFDSTTTSYTLASTSLAPLTLSSSTGTAAINVQNGSHFITAPVQLLSNTQITVDTGSSLGISGTISGAANVIFGGGGTLVLTGTHNYTGSTTVNAGTLQVGTTTTSGSLTSPVTVNSGGSLLFGTASSSSSPIVLNKGTLGIVSGGSSPISATMGALSLISGTTSVIDFGVGSIGNTITTLVNGAQIGLQAGTVLNVFDYNGTAYGAGQNDTTSMSTPTQDHFLIGTIKNTIDAFSQVNFYSGNSTSSTLIGTGQEVSFGSEYEIVPLSTAAAPEPGTMSVAVGLLALLLGSRFMTRPSNLGCAKSQS